jgi:Tol biopolymer transport system component
MTDLDHVSLDRLLPAAPGEADWDDVLSRAGAHEGRRRRSIVMLAAAGLLVVLGTASAFGVRGFVLGTNEGSSIAFQSYRNGSFDLYVMNADGSKSRRLTPTGGDGWPAWSPDGQRIAYTNWSGRDNDIDIYTTNVDGSGRQRLTRNPAHDSVAPTWSPDGRTIAFTRNVVGRKNGRLSFESDVYLIDADGGGERNLTQDGMSGGAVWSPDGQRIAFMSSRDRDPGVYVMSADGGEPRLLTREPGLLVDWSPLGKILLVRGVGRGHGGPAMSYIYVVNADGSGLRRLTRMAQVNFSLPVWSPDGKKILFTSDRDGDFEVYVMNADGSGQRNLTRNPAHDSAPTWSPDGRKILFTTKRDGNFEVYVMNADGSGQRNLTRDPAPDRAPAWSPGRPRAT